ncbi:MAG: nucleoid-associated protein [Clostridium sp.]
MKSDDIIMKTGIVHILDSSVGVPVLSDCPIDLSGDLSDFLKAHIEKLTESDDVKLCRFGNDSPVKQLLEQCTPETFVETQQAAGPAALRHYER